MTTVAQRYAQNVIAETKGAVLKPEGDVLLLGDEATIIAVGQVELAKRRGQLLELITSSDNIDGDVNGAGYWTNDPRVLVGRIAFLCLQQTVIDLVVASPAVA